MMKQAMLRATSGDTDIAALTADIRDNDSPAMRRRRAVVASSFVGIASMAIVTAFQTGLIRHLPDPKRGKFHSDKVNSSPTAFGYGLPDAPLTLGAHAANIALAAAGPADRAKRRPWLPVTASILAGAQAAVAAKYLFHQMPKVDKAWCPYCITDALAHFTTFALTLPETGQALRSAALRE